VAGENVSAAVWSVNVCEIACALIVTASVILTQLDGVIVSELVSVSVWISTFVWTVISDRI